MSHENSVLKAKYCWALDRFLIPILIWCAVSYLPFIWHPQVQITNSGSVSFLQVGSRVDKECFMQKRKMPSIQALNRHKVIWSIRFIYLHPPSCDSLSDGIYDTTTLKPMHHGFIKVFGTVSRLYSVLSLLHHSLGLPWGFYVVFPTKFLSSLNPLLSSFATYLRLPLVHWLLPY